MRLDKYISSCTTLSRNEVKKVIKKGVLVNNILIKSPNFKVNEDDKVQVDGEILEYRKYIYIMLNKEKNVVSATQDARDKAVIDYLSDKDKILATFPVGRLDKDTEGLILLTNNGDLAHNLLSPKKNIDKKYYVEVDGQLNSSIVDLFLQGVHIGDYKCKSSKLEIIFSSEEKSKAFITISEGKFHQIKRMMKAVNLNVIYLKRLTIGNLVLDENLKLGEYRYLTKEEIEKIQNK
ncbi:MULTISPECIES: pseudouridine synthase [unclassified Gemella]|uniref:pseudouridine synthase n=1 Tax=unclassified Gemella TaxID=2624949 RepID=UPI001C043B28|nr:MULTISPECIES: pseudouridine synthase [unclassified Gemella]MBU0278798.1 rRNA pseudouridine synthase [Gemella sp. zg-1178]QWQ39348.1 rRNA pseudouridine synthase [Gemella sp. zg-570]